MRVSYRTDTRGSQARCKSAPPTETLLITDHTGLPISAWTFVVGRADEGYGTLCLRSPLKRKVNGFRVVHVWRMSEPSRSVCAVMIAHKRLEARAQVVVRQS